MVDFCTSSDLKIFFGSKTNVYIFWLVANVFPSRSKISPLLYGSISLE